MRREAMNDNKKLWLTVRIVLIILAFVQGSSFIDSFPGDFSKAAWPFFFEVLGIVAISVFAITSFLLPSSASKEKWPRPSWFTNLLNFRQALTIFDFASYYLLSLGLGCLVFGFLRNPLSWVWELPVATGLGMFFGVHAVLILFQNRFET
jgi:hypothetical protein